MKTIVASVAILTWGLWFGGVITLFICVQRLFTFNHDLAAISAPQLFSIFGKYQIVLSAVGLAAGFFWRLQTRTAWATTFFFLLALAFAAAVFSQIYITPAIEWLRAQDQVHTPAFRKLHGFSMMVYVSEAVALLFAGTIIPVVFRRQAE